MALVVAAVGRVALVVAAVGRVAQVVAAVGRVALVSLQVVEWRWCRGRW